MGEPALPVLPRVLVATDGAANLSPGLAGAEFLRDLDLTALVQRVNSAGPPCALDIDGVEGLNADAAGVRFVVEELGIRIILTRRPAIAMRITEAGALALLHVFAFDSTGLGRSLDAHPEIPGVGTVISPGPVLPHLAPEDRARLPRPLVAYGLISTVDMARTVLALADSLIVRAGLAGALLDDLAGGRGGRPVHPSALDNGRPRT